MTSLERIFFYSTKLPQEKENVEIKPEESWPEKGAIEFQKVTFRLILIFFFFPIITLILFSDIVLAFHLYLRTSLSH
jgi:hypothetical protein